MSKSKTIITEIEEMLHEKQITFDSLTHLSWIEERKSGKHFSMSEHIRGLIYSLLSNNRPWQRIESNIDEIDEIFFEYDKDKILATNAVVFIDRLQAIKCGNRNIKNQMNSLHANIRKLERIEKEFGTLDNFVTSGSPLEIADLLANSIKYKLSTFGLALAMEYLRTVGIDATKPDTHIRRILGKNRLGYSVQQIAGEIEAIEIIDTISSQTGYSASKIDAILWLFCSDENGMICTEKPHCDQCKLNGKYCRYLAYRMGNFMTDEEKKNARYGAILPDVVVKESQCAECLHSKGKNCDAFGEKPRQYVSTVINEPCPKRMSIN